MTPDELRSLADEATPGPWEKTHSACHVAAPDLRDEGYWVDVASTETEYDARLIALAPDLARLCAEYAGAFEQIAKLHPKDRAESAFIAHRALVKLAELGS